METKRTALIIHGYGLNESDWHRVVWGNTEHGLLGRAPMGILIAHRRKPELIIWNTGATELEGMFEGKYTLEYALEHVPELQNQFHEFQNIDARELAAYLRLVSIIETKSRRTTESLIEAIPYLTQDGRPRYAEVMQVTSKNHAPRVLRDSIDIWWEQRGLMITTSVYPAQTGYHSGTAGATQITDSIS